MTAPTTAIRRVDMICIHAHGGTPVYALRELADTLDSPDYRKLTLMDVFVSEPTEECETKLGMCVTALLAIPGTGRMLS